MEPEAKQSEPQWSKGYTKTLLHCISYCRCFTRRETRVLRTKLCWL